MVGHSRSHIKISTLHNTATIKEGENAPRTHYLTQGPFWMESMSSISEYPTTRAACEQLQQAALLAEEAADSVLCGRTLAGCALSAQAYDSSPALVLPAGTSFHILAETENDRLHIYVPSGGLGSEVDTNGTYGYVSKSAVITGASAATLDVLEKEAEN